MIGSNAYIYMCVCVCIHIIDIHVYGAPHVPMLYIYINLNCPCRPKVPGKSVIQCSKTPKTVSKNLDSTYLWGSASNQ